MKIIGKYFVVSLLMQASLLGFIWLTGWLDGIMYLFYLFPWAVVDLISPAPMKVFEAKGFLVFCLILGAPASVYSLVASFSLYVLSPRRLK